jgi:hypothetical protein
MGRIVKFVRRKRSSAPWIYQRTQIFKLTRYRIVKSGILAVLAIILLVAVIAHKMIGDNVNSPVIEVFTPISVTEGDTVRSGG